MELQTVRSFAVEAHKARAWMGLQPGWGCSLDGVAAVAETRAAGFTLHWHC
jgi:hypothetical protein